MTFEIRIAYFAAAMTDPPNHFFKFIPPGFKFNLSIPKSFLTKLDGWRGKKAILRRGCHNWAVHIGDGGVFGDGWSKFVVENGVQEFDIIVFKHQGNMVFDFLVFDPSACERQYPNLPKEVEVSLPQSSDSLHTHERSKILKKRKRADYSSQSKDERLRLDDDSCFVTVMTPYNITSSRLSVPLKFARSNGLTTKRMRTQIVLVDEAKRTCPAELHIRTDQIRLTGWHKLMIKNGLKVGDACMFKLVEEGEVPVFNFYNLGKKRTNNYIPVKEESSSRIKKMDNASCDNHPYFILSMKSYSREAGLYLPIEFSISSGLDIGEMILRDDEGRSWKTQLRKSGEKYLCFNRGFRAFWDVNGLKVGEEYKFVLVENEKGKPPVMNVSYLGKKNTNNHVQVTKESKPTIKIKKTTGSSLGNHPYFILTMRPSYRECGLYLPVEFSKTNGLKVGEMILIDAKGGSWKIQLKKKGEKYLSFGRGFRDFWDANGLEVGDDYKFVLDEKEKGKPPIMIVSYLGKKNTNNHVQVKKESKPTIKIQKTTGSSLGNRPYFILTMRLSIRECGLYLPANFWISNGLKVGEMILRDDRGRSWKVQLNKHGKKRLYIGRGFRDFWVANGLMEGNAYKFELAENEKDKPPVVNFSLAVDSTPSEIEDRHPSSAK
ncbi:putative transcription factor B3-Domain family [Helianthus annuus]|nr:putative transcription factor B3-Domain family [Helianthus annuus]